MKLDPTISPIDTQPLSQTSIVRGDQVLKAPRPSITAPTGGGTQDAEARTAINALITTLEQLGLIKPN